MAYKRRVQWVHCTQGWGSRKTLEYSEDFFFALHLTIGGTQLQLLLFIATEKNSLGGPAVYVVLSI